VAERIARRAAPAKINLYLHVLGRRADRYHLLDSLVAFADIGDAVEAQPADALRLAIGGPFAAPLAAETHENLVLSAARALAARHGIAPKAALHLEKNLPVASGIGGGSADAAAALHCLAELWRVRVPEDLPAQLGADVPVCLSGRAAWLGGIGEDLRPAPALPGVGIVLANPLVPLPTPAVFKARTGPFSEAARFETPPVDARALARLLEQRRNDLTDAAIGIVPAIADVLRALADAPGTLLARMSGSGATCFALFDDRPAAERAAQWLRERHRDWWIAAGTTLK
jgi:4-diphosphocytidyl-2-C-methyl-D-erythritol kinase